MAQSGYTPISIYYSATTTNVPTAGNLVAGELAINTADGKLFYKDSAGVVQVIGTKGGVGSSTTTQVLYNSSGLVVGSANMTFDGTKLTLANDASISGLTVGKGGGSVGTNTVLGTSAGTSNSTGATLTAVGYLAGTASTADANTFIGAVAGTTNTSGTENTALGTAAMRYTTTGSQLVAIGRSALSANTTGSANTAVGKDALISNTTASNNTAVGYQAGYSNTTGSSLTTLGYQAGYSNTTGTNNTYLGYQNGIFAIAGSNNTGVGSGNFTAGTNGSNNTAVGSGALAVVTASNNTAVGYQAGYTNSTGTYNTFLGTTAGYSQNSVGYNTFVGDRTGYSSTSGQNNTFIGQGAGYYVTTGGKNTILGRYTGNQGGLDITTASNYIVLSDGDGNPRQIIDSSGYAYFGCASNPSASVFGVRIGTNGTNFWLSSASVTSSYQHMQFGNTNGFVGSISTSASLTIFSTTSDYRLKNVIGSFSDAGTRIDALEPIEYEWKAGGKTRGFLAHKFAEVYPDSVIGEKDAIDAEGKPIYQAMQASTPEVIADLVAEIQSLRKRIATLEGK